MTPPALHRAADRLAMWWEDRAARAPAPFRPASAEPLAAFEPLGALPPPPAGPGLHRLRAPAGGDLLAVHVFAPRGARRGTAILAPPWKIPRVAAVRGWVSLLLRAGLEAWVAVPPHHLERAAPGRRSGEAFFSPDLARTRRNVEQAVRELRLHLALAAARGPAGLVGLSLGALAAGLAATGPERAAFAVLVAPPADLGAVLADTPIGRRYRRLAEAAGAPLPPADALRPMLQPLEPRARAPTARRLFLAAGAHDAVAVGGPAALSAAWGLAPNVYPRGHLTLLFACRRLRRDVADFLRG